jgi:hypothetical protein
VLGKQVGNICNIGPGFRGEVLQAAYASLILSYIQRIIRFVVDNKARIERCFNRMCIF